MVAFAVGKPVTTDTPVVTVDAGLPPGQQRFTLVVVDDSGRRSQPDQMIVTILGRIVVGPVITPPPIGPAVDPTRPPVTGPVLGPATPPVIGPPAPPPPVIDPVHPPVTGPVVSPVIVRGIAAPPAPGPGPAPAPKSKSKSKSKRRKP